MSELGERLAEGVRFDARRVARIFDVPPWVVAGGVPRPRFARLRWRLRRVFPWLVWS